MSQLPRSLGRPPGPPQEEEAAIPLEPAVAKERSVFIRENIKKIETLRAAGKSKEEIDAEIPSFIEDYPSLYKMIMKTGATSDGSLKTMLSMLEKMGEAQLSQHQASVIVGQRLHDVFIKPKMPDMERKED